MDRPGGTRWGSRAPTSWSANKADNEGTPEPGRLSCGTRAGERPLAQAPVEFVRKGGCAPGLFAMRTLFPVWTRPDGHVRESAPEGPCFPGPHGRLQEGACVCLSPCPCVVHTRVCAHVFSLTSSAPRRESMSEPSSLVPRRSPASVARWGGRHPSLTGRASGEPHTWGMTKRPPWGQEEGRRQCKQSA